MKSTILLISVILLFSYCSNSTVEKENDLSPEDNSKRVIEDYIKTKVTPIKDLRIIEFGTLAVDSNFLNMEEYKKVLLEEIKLEDDKANYEAYKQLNMKTEIDPKSFDSISKSIKNRYENLEKGNVGYYRYATYAVTNEAGLTEEKSLYFRFDTIMKVIKVNDHLQYNEYDRYKNPILNEM